MTDTKRVPREPTRAMIEAGNAQPYNTNRVWIWQAMYDAAPTEPDTDALIDEMRMLAAATDRVERKRILLGAIDRIAALEAEVRAATERAQALHAALRQRTIVRVESVMRGDVKGTTCAICRYHTWFPEFGDKDERHAPGCLAAPQGEP